MDQQMNAVAFPLGGSLRLSGTMLRNSAEFQAMTGQGSDHQAGAQHAAQRGRAEGTWHAMRGLWE